MRVLDLYSGLGGWSAAFRDRGHFVVTADLDPRFGSDLVLDVNDLRGLNGWDVILASPPCETFSVASIGRHWSGGRRAYIPRSEKARAALRLVAHTAALIMRDGRHYVIENPRGVMRKVIPDYMGEPATTWMCQWGVRNAKPTDLWTNLSGTWPTCANGRKDHDEARRGAKTGTQGIKGSAARALIPYRLSLAVCLACERDGTLPAMDEVIALESELRRAA